MDRRHRPQLPLLWMTLVAGLLAAPFFAIAQGQPAPGPSAPPATTPAMPGARPAFDDGALRNPWTSPR